MNTLKMSDTPETDFHCWTDSSGEELIAVCKAEFCRKLERERDEAMELLASEKITRNHIIKRSVEVERERDEAREDLEFRRGLYKVQEQYLETARRERDEAREEVRTLKGILDLLKKEAQ